MTPLLPLCHDLVPKLCYHCGVLAVAWLHDDCHSSSVLGASTSHCSPSTLCGLVYTLGLRQLQIVGTNVLGLRDISSSDGLNHIREGWHGRQVKPIWVPYFLSNCLSQATADV